MSDNRDSRLRRARKTRLKISELNAIRLSIYRSNLHIYAQIFDTKVGKVLISASSTESDFRNVFVKGGNKDAATEVGKRIAQKAKAIGISTVAFDRSGFRYHGRVKALAEAARDAGLKF